MSDADVLLQAALVGTERPWTLPATDANDAVDQLLREAYALAAPDAPGQLLRLAGVQAVCAQAGWMPAANPAPLAAVAAPETRTLAGIAWANLLSQALIHGPRRLQLQVLHAMDRPRLCVPPHLLPSLLQAGQQSVDMRASVVAVMGERGRWLASHNPDWSYACGAQEQADPQTLWDHGSLEQRCTVLRNERASATQAARERLTTDWSNLAAKDRAALLATLRVGLCADDEAFLSAQLKDRAQDVRRTAADLLAALPTSAYSQRMVARLLPLVALQTATPGMVGRLLGNAAEVQVTLQAPSEFGPDWKADLLEQERPKYEPLGERAWWLFQLASRSPLAWWTQHSGLDPAGLLAAAKASDWNDALLRGWSHALLWQPDAAWAQALLENSPARWDARSSLLALLGPEQREQFHLTQLATSTNLPEVASSCLAGCAPHAHLGPLVSQRLAQLLRQQIDQGALVNDYSLRSQLPDLACALHPQALPLLANVARSAEETASLSECLGLLAHVVHSHTHLFQLSEETPTP